MNKSAQYILSAYSFIFSNPLDNLLDVGLLFKGGNPIPSFDENTLTELCSDVQQIFEEEKNILDLEGDFIIVGDIHGSLHDLLRIINFIQDNDAKVLFLGDYVDRGSFSLECITILFALKIMKPDSFYLIRGNHEFDSVCSQYGFKDEIINYHNPKKQICLPSKQTNLDLRKSKSLILQIENNSEDNNDEYDIYSDRNRYKYSENLYYCFMKAFSYLPIAAILNKTTFCIHGGLSPKLDRIDSINTLINRPINSFDENQLLSDLVWSDPAHSSSCSFDENPRGRGYLFNRDTVSRFLKDSSLVRMLRAHQCVQTGSQKNFGDKCITVFSASSYDKNMGNCSAVLQLSQQDDSISATTFSPISRIEKSEAVFYKVQALNPNDKIQFCFSLLHPKLVSNRLNRRMATKSFKHINTHQSENSINYHLKANPLLKGTKFITNPRKSLQLSKSPIGAILNDNAIGNAEKNKMVPVSFNSP